MPSQRGWLRMSVEVEEELYPSSCLSQTVKNLRSTLKKCGFFPEGVTFITQEDPIKPTIIAIYYGLKKIPEKNGAM
jgi:hypothetical protein